MQLRTQDLHFLGLLILPKQALLAKKEKGFHTFLMTLPKREGNESGHF